MSESCLIVCKSRVSVSINSDAAVVIYAGSLTTSTTCQCPRRKLLVSGVGLIFSRLLLHIFVFDNMRGFQALGTSIGIFSTTIRCSFSMHAFYG